MKTFRPRAWLMPALLLSAAVSGCSDNSTSSDDEIRLGGVFSLTGNWSTLGLNSDAAMRLAVADVNAHIGGSGPRFRALVADSRLDPERAVLVADSLSRRGVELIIGPQSSAEVAALKSFVDENDMLLVSQSSTAGTLAIPGDNIFRLTPSDSLEGLAITALMRLDGIQAVVPIWRSDAGNAGLEAAMRREFTAAGGTVSQGAGYAADATDFSAAVAAVGAQVRQALATRPASGVGVYLAGFDEVAEILELAAADPVLATVRWYGADGTALSAALLGSDEAVAFAEQVGFPNPMFGLDDAAAPRYLPIAQRIRAETGIEPDAFALAVYDAVWIAAEAYLASDGSPGIDGLKARFTTAAASHFGTTGWTALNAAGDRANADFDFWSMRRVDGTAKWVRTARYDSGTGMITR